VASRLVQPQPGSTYESLRAAFRWTVPERLNLARACADDQVAGDLALVSLDDEGRVSRLTFGELSSMSARIAGGLRALGVEPRDRVGVVIPQSPETGLVHLAIWRLGAISLPLAALFGPDALRYRIRDAGAKFVVTTRANAAKVREAAPEVRVLTVEDDLPGLLVSGPVDVADTSPDDPAFLIYTSGTTGPPKGALEPHRSVYGHLPGFELLYEFAPQPGDLIWTPADWAWIGALMDVVVPAWFHGIPVVTSSSRFDPQRAIDMMAEQRVTLAFLPPTALKMMRAADVSRPDLSLRAIFSGGEPLGAEVLAWAEDRLGTRINEGYGQTEANLVIGNCSSVWPIRPGSMGRAFPGHDVAVLDDDGQAVVGVEAEICVRSPDPVMMLEYWNAPKATASKYRDGWLRTGDLAVQDQDGYFWFRSRTDDVITSMGYRIGPGEIEESLMGHPAVAMCAVIGIPDEIRGHVPAAFVVVREGVVADDVLVVELQEHVRRRLAAHDVPRKVTFLDELPRTVTGKILRRALREG
jgi:acetyl-CoA synthetase